MDYLYSTLVLFFLVMNPLGNLPIFIAELNRYSPERYKSIVLRECCVALGVLLLFLFCGNGILRILQISKASVEVAGGIILFLIALKLIFSDGTNQENMSDAKPQREPFVVPLAIPLFAGPASMSTAILVGGRSEGRLWIGAVALLLAWLVCTLILLSGRYAGKIMSPRALFALESLMGLLLTTIAVEMIIKGLRMAF